MYNLTNQKAPREIAGRFLFVNQLLNRDVARLGSLGALFNIELDLLTFGQVAVAIALNCGEMDENVLATVIRLDESVALCRVKPFHSSRSHGNIPYIDKQFHRRTKDAPRDIDFIWKFQQTPFGEWPIWPESMKLTYGASHSLARHKKYLFRSAILKKPEKRRFLRDDEACPHAK